MDARNFFLQMGTSLNNFKHKRKKSPTPIKKMAHKRRKNASHMEEKSPVRWKKTPYMNFFFDFQLGGRAPRALEQWAKMIIKWTIFSEIIHHIIISRYTLECTQLHYCIKFSGKSIPSNPLAMKLNSVIHTVTTKQAGCITIPPHYLKILPHV